MPPTDILLLDGESPFTAKVVRSLARARRWRIHLLARSGGSPRPRLEWSRHVRSFHWCRAGRGEDDHLEAIQRAVRTTGARAVVPVTEETTLFCIRHRAAIGRMAPLPPLPEPEVFSLAIDKARLAAFMEAHGIPHPVTRLPADLEALRFPVAVKLRRALGGAGMAVTSTLAQLRQHLGARADVDHLHVQEYISGHDMGCSVLAEAGRIEAATVQRGIRRPQPFCSYSEVSIEPEARVLAVARRLVAALGWSGVANIDFRVGEDGQPRVLELNGRYWDSLLASTLAGVNFPDLVCRRALGEPVRQPPVDSGRFMHAKPWLRELLRGRWPGCRTDLPMLLADPAPVLFRVR